MVRQVFFVSSNLKSSGMFAADLFAEVVDLSFDIAPVVARHHDDDCLSLEIKSVVIGCVCFSVAFIELAFDENIAGCFT